MFSLFCHSVTLLTHFQLVILQSSDLLQQGCCLLSPSPSLRLLSQALSRAGWGDPGVSLLHPPALVGRSRTAEGAQVLPSPAQRDPAHGTLPPRARSRPQPFSSFALRTDKTSPVAPCARGLLLCAHLEEEPNSIVCNPGT